VGPPTPYSPFNCRPEFVRMTSTAVPNSQVCGAGRGGAGWYVDLQRLQLSRQARRTLTAGARLAPLLQALKARWHLPYGAVVHPMALAGGPVPVANPTGGTIIRCKRCRTYMNPFMSWMDGGRWAGRGWCGLLGGWVCGWAFLQRHLVPPLCCCPAFCPAPRA